MLQYDYRVIGYEMKYVVVCEPSTGAAVGLRIGVVTVCLCVAEQRHLRWAAVSTDACVRGLYAREPTSVL